MIEWKKILVSKEVGMRKEIIIGSIAVVVLAAVSIWLIANASTKDETVMMQTSSNDNVHSAN